MKRSRFSEEQIIGVLKEHQAAQFARLQTASASYDLAANGQIALP